MALDGMTLHLLRAEMRQWLLGARVDKIYQPAREELILSLRGQRGSCRLLLSAKASGPRTHLTDLPVENPKQPPMFCMLLRKLIGSARLVEIRQPGFERALSFDFEAVNELGDLVRLSLVAEIMGRHSNIVLVGQDGRIVDAVKRIGPDRSSVRQVLPGLAYEPPPPQTRIAVTEGAAAVIEALRDAARDIELSKLLQETLEGASPILCRELTHRACRGRTPLRSELTDADFARLAGVLGELAARLEGDPSPTMVLTSEGEPKDFTFLPVEQYGGAMQTRSYPNLSALLDAFYGERDATERMKQKMSDFSRNVANRIERVERRVAAQKEELLNCLDRDRLRMAGDLLSANLHRLEKGMDSATLEDFYDPEGGSRVIELDPRLTPVQNAQRYYKEYRKADTAERMLRDRVAEGERELVYLDTVSDMMGRATSEAELAAIRAELAQGGYLRAAPGARRRGGEDKLPPLRYRSSDGFLICSGRNNLQNDRLTLKDSRNGDLWFHVQKMAGAHTVVNTEGREVPDRTLTEAAVIAAVNSRASRSRKVPVDYTLIKYVKKQPGGKPGMVIYENFNTAIVDPDEELARRLSLGDNGR